MSADVTGGVPVGVVAPASFRQLVGLERFKLGRRPMPKILLAILVAITFGVPWLFFATLGGIGENPSGGSRQELLDRLVYPDVLDASVENALSFGLPLLIVLTSASFGGEFAWGTIRLLLGRGEGRAHYVMSKLVAIAVWWLLAVGLATAAALGAGALIAAVDGSAGPGSVGAGEWAAFAGRFLLAWAASFAYAALAALITVQFRSTALGLACGLAAFFGEGIFDSAVLDFDVPLLEGVVRAGLNYNLRSLMGTLDGQENAVPVAAAAVLGYVLLAFGLTVRHLRRQDVVIAGVG